MKHFYLIFTLFLSVLVYGQTPFTSTITPDLSAYGEVTSYPGEGEYQIFYGGAGEEVMNKPIILVDGFDPGDTRPINGFTDPVTNMYVPGIYDLLNFNDGGTSSNLADDLRADGFDVVILNFPEYTRLADGALIDGGTDFIERNAMLLVDLINIVNVLNEGTEENVIIGPSMGGLISRYALNYMENQSITHETRLFISFDSPHLGANVPIGFQHQFNYLAFGLGANNVTTLQPVVDGFLKSSASRQLLTDHFEAHLATGSDVEFDPTLTEPAAHPFRSFFTADVNMVGFPQNVRNVSMINGSGIGSPYQDKLGGDIGSGFVALSDIFDVAAATTAEVDVNFTPAANTTSLVSKLKVVLVIVIPITIVETEALSQATTFAGIDPASGGLFDIAGLTEGIDTSGLAGDFLAALNTDKFNFIPSVSAMALEVTNDEVDWFHDIDLGMPGRATINNTPFANWYMPDDNEDHVALTAANVQFALDEINQSTLSISSLDTAELRLEKNPIQNRLVFLSNNVINDATLIITDITGKTVVNSRLDITNRTELDIQLTSGLYIVNITSPDNGNFVTKLVVR